MPGKRHYLTVGGTPLCELLGCAAGQDIAKKAGADLDVHPVDVTCGHRTGASAKRTAAVLRRFFCVPVKAVAGDCPVSV